MPEGCNESGWDTRKGWMGKVVRHSLQILCLTFVLNLLGCAGLSRSKVPVGGVEIPFAAHQAGAVVETDLLIKEDRSYIFELMLWFKNMSDMDFIEKFAWIGGGVPIHLAVEVTGLEAANRSFVYSKKLHAGGSTAHGFPKVRPPGMAGYHTRHIAYIRLKPGLYHVRVTSLEDVPKLAEIPVSFSISYNSKIEKYR